MGTYEYCAPLVTDLVLFCYKKDSILSFSAEIQVHVFEACNSISRYLDI